MEPCNIGLFLSFLGLTLGSNGHQNHNVLPVGAPAQVATGYCYDCRGPHSPDFVQCLNQVPGVCEHGKVCLITRTPSNTETEIYCANNHECGQQHHLPECKFTSTGDVTSHCHHCCTDLICTQQALGTLVHTNPTSPPPTTAPLATASTPGASTTAQQSNPATPMHTTPPPLSCVQCGDYDARVPCTNEELLADNVTACVDSTATRCMTDVFTDSGAQISIFKRCVQQGPCQQLWYDQTSDKHVCVTFDPTSAVPDLTCHFCCVGSSCNINIVPAHDLQWRP